MNELFRSWKETIVVWLSKICDSSIAEFFHLKHFQLSKKKNKKKTVCIYYVLAQSVLWMIPH